MKLLRTKDLTMLRSLQLRDEQIEKTIAVILRVPALFLLDFWYQSSTKETLTEVLRSSDLISLISTLVLVQGLLLLLLPLEDLVTLYMHYLSAALILCCEILSYWYTLAKDQPKGSDVQFFPFSSLDESIMATKPVTLSLISIVLPVIMATTVTLLLEVKSSAKKVVLAVYTVPITAKLAHFPLYYLELLHNFSRILIFISVLYYIIRSLPCFLSYIHKAYKSAAIILVQQGPVNAIITVWESSFLMPQFILFWCVHVALQLHSFWYYKYLPPGQMVVSPIIERGDWYLIILYALSNVCTTPISLLGCCIAVSYMSWTVLKLTKILAKGTSAHLLDRELERAGISEGIAMALFALQTGLVDLPMPQRMGAMCIILFIVVGSLVQSMHEIVEPIMLALSASHSHSVLRHVRILTVSLFLLVFPLYMTFFLCQLFEIDLWTLVIISTCTLTSVQVLGALIIYGLFMYDALQKDCSWESLDDNVYFTRAIIRVLEFVVAVFVVGSGIHESLLLSSEGRPWSWLNGSALAVHCYFNVYQRLQSGWRCFLLRREAARKILSLPCASADELKSHSHDVCAICYFEMKTACVTPCQHLFHAQCLKKWLYIQDRCPLCSTQITTAGKNTNKVPENNDLPVQEDINSENFVTVNTSNSSNTLRRDVDISSVTSTDSNTGTPISVNCKHSSVPGCSEGKDTVQFNSFAASGNGANDCSAK